MESLQTMSLAWNAILKIVLLSGILSSVLAALGTWLVMRFTKPLDSYTEEFAKQVARHQNLDKLVEETRRLTDTAEKIKAELSHEVWDRQTRFIAKRDLYVSIAEALGELRNFYIKAKGMERLRLQGVMERPSGAEFEKQRQENSQAMEAAAKKLFHAQDTAPLIMPDAPYKPLREFIPRKTRFGTPSWEQDIEYNIEKVRWTLYQFQVAARADLGFEPLVWKPTILTPPPAETDPSGAELSQ
jgi:hypothetical protein